MPCDENNLDDDNNMEFLSYPAKCKLLTTRNIGFIIIILISGSFIWLYKVYENIDFPNLNEHFNNDVTVTAVQYEDTNSNKSELITNIYNKTGYPINNDLMASDYNYHHGLLENNRIHENLFISTDRDQRIDENIISKNSIKTNENSSKKSVFNNSLLYKDNNLWIKKVIKENFIKQSSQNIFFIETSCGTQHSMGKLNGPMGNLKLNPRQSCAIESTAKINPDYNVYLYHTCKINETFFDSSPDYIKSLFSYNNFYTVQVNMNEFFKSTPLQDMWVKIEESSYPLEHMSDAMRLVVLWRYGGTYLDLDIVSVKSLSNLDSNFAGVQDEDTINGAVLNFEPDGFAHKLLTTCLENFRDKFDGSQWATNGPALVTNALLQLCHASKVSETIGSECEGFHVYPSYVFYAIHFSDWQSFFDENEKDRVMKAIEKSTIVHLWNYMSHGSNLTVIHGSNQPYSILANDYCPRVYQNVNIKFR